MQILFLFFKSLVLIIILIFAIFIVFYFEKKFLLKIKGYTILNSFIYFLRLLLKEEALPEKKFLLSISPFITLILPFLSFAIIPVGKKPLIQDINISLLFVILILSLNIYGIILTGISSGSKSVLLSSLRTSISFLSFYIPLMLSITGIIIQAESFSLREIVEKQNIPYIFPQFFGFTVFFISSIAYLKRKPFDFTTMEFEIVDGYKAEYSGTKFAYFILGEYAELLFISSLITILYLGKSNVFLFLIKTFIITFIFCWIKVTFPRIKIEQFVKFFWKYLIPLSFLNLIIISIFKTLK